MAERTRGALGRGVRVVLLLYGIQVALVGFSWLFPAIDVEDERCRYTVTRFQGVLSFVPLLGSIPEVTGEPVWWIVRDQRTGAITAKQYDLIEDVQAEHPVARGQRFVRRLLDSR